MMKSNFFTKKKTSGGPAPSMDQILSSIKDVINGNADELYAEDDEEEVFELTQLAEQDQAKDSQNFQDTQSEILSRKIEQSLKGKKFESLEYAISKKNEPAPAESYLKEAIASKLGKTTQQNDYEAENALSQNDLTNSGASPKPKQAPSEDYDFESNFNQEPPERHSIAHKTSAINAKIAENKEHILSKNTLSSAEQTLSKLKNSISKPSVKDINFESGSSMEALVCQLMEPHLKEWLDKNLPLIVTRIVEREIKKIVPQEEL